MLTYDTTTNNLMEPEGNELCTMRFLLGLTYSVNQIDGARSQGAADNQILDLLTL